MKYSPENDRLRTGNPAELTATTFFFSVEIIFSRFSRGCASPSAWLPLGGSRDKQSFCPRLRDLLLEITVTSGVRRVPAAIDKDYDRCTPSLMNPARDGVGVNAICNGEGSYIPWGNVRVTRQGGGYCWRVSFLFYFNKFGGKLRCGCSLDPPLIVKVSKSKLKR